MIQTGIQVLIVGIKMRDWVTRSRILKVWHQAWHPEIQTYLVWLCFTDSVFLTNWMFLPTLNPASPSASFFLQPLFTPCLCVTFWWFLQYFKHFLYYHICHGDQWSVFFNVTTQWRLRWWLALKYLKIKECILFFRHNSIIQLVVYSIE